MIDWHKEEIKEPFIEKVARAFKHRKTHEVTVKIENGEPVVLAVSREKIE